MAIQKRLAAAGASAVLTAAGSIAYFYEGEVLGSYVDPVGIITACVGSTTNVRIGDIYSEQECTDKFLADLRTAERAVNRCTPEIPDGMKPSLISFTFNVGSGAYCSSTLAVLANAGDYLGACKQLYRWVYAGGRVLPGLVNRREAEAADCIMGLL